MDLFNGKYFKENNIRVLNEENFYSDGKYMIGMDDSSSRGYGLLKDPYIKVFQGKSRDAANNNIRIRLKDGITIIHSDGKGNLSLNSKIKKLIIEAIKGNCTLGKYKGLPVWDSIWNHLDILSKSHNTPIGIDYIPLEVFIDNFNKNN